MQDDTRILRDAAYRNEVSDWLASRATDADKSKLHALVSTLPSAKTSSHNRAPAPPSPSQGTGVLSNSGWRYGATATARISSSSPTLKSFLKTEFRPTTAPYLPKQQPDTAAGTLPSSAMHTRRSSATSPSPHTHVSNTAALIVKTTSPSKGQPSKTQSSKTIPPVSYSAAASKVQPSNTFHVSNTATAAASASNTPLQSSSTATASKVQPSNTTHVSASRTVSNTPPQSSNTASMTAGAPVSTTSPVRRPNTVNVSNLTTNQAHLGLPTYEPDLYWRIRNANTSKLETNRNFESAWGDSLKKGSEAIGASFLRSSYNAANEAVMERINFKPKKFGQECFFDFFAKQKLYYSEILSPEAQRDFEAAFARANDDEKKEMVEFIRQLYLVANPNTKKPLSHSAHNHQYPDPHTMFPSNPKFKASGRISQQSTTVRFASPQTDIRPKTTSGDRPMQQEVPLQTTRSVSARMGDTTSPKRDTARRMLESQVPMGLKRNIYGSNSTYTDMHGARGVPSRTQKGPLADPHFQDFSCPFGAIDRQLAITSVRNSYPVPHSFFSSTSGLP